MKLLSPWVCCWHRLMLGLACLVLCSVARAEDTPPAETPTEKAAEAAPAADASAAEKAPAADDKKAPAADKSAAKAAEELTLEQQQLSARFKHFEEVLQRMAELTAANDPQRAALLRKAAAQSKDALIGSQLERLVELLKQDRLAVAVGNQKEVSEDLGSLLELLLSEDRGKRLASEQARIKEYIKRVNRLIKEEEAIKDQTDRGADSKDLSDRQGKTAEKTGDLARDIRDTEEAGKPGSSSKAPGGEDQKKDAKEGEGKDSEGKEGESKEGEGKEGEGKEQPGKEGEPKQGDNKEGKDAGKEGDAKENEGKEGQEPGDKEGKPSGGKSSKGSKGKKGDKSKDQDKKSPDDKQDGEKKDGDDKQDKDDADKKDQEGQSEGKGKPQKPMPGQGQPQQGEPGDDEDQQAAAPPPQDNDNPARKRIEAAEKKMKQAQEKLEKAKRGDAKADQEEAIRELEQAKAELEAILRQLREEQVGRMLALLEARFRKMLEIQIQVYESTLRLDRVPEDKRDQDVQVESGRLSRKESTIHIEAEKALSLLREEGSSVAMPEAVEQMRDDMAQVASRLSQTKVGSVTQGLEEDIISALEELIAALEKAQQEMEKKKSQGQPQQGEPQDQPLVDKIAELKVIRSLQMRVNKRTQRYSKLIDGEEAADPDLLKALDQLADREQKVFRATKDIATGKNK